VPPGFRDWGEYEYRARELTIWVPNVPDGIAQTADYARALLSTSPGATDNVIDARLRNRLERQQRLLRDDGPAIVLLVDQVALYRGTGSAQIMAAQCRRLIEVSALETVTLQIVPHVAHRWRPLWPTSATRPATRRTHWAGNVMVRDTTNREGGTLSFAASAWGRFIKSL
jgi:Domain of unknown function (DUF5753)/Domain of unknown function (DUF397)